MSIYTKSKTSVSNLDVVKNFATDDSFKVGIAQGAENIIIDYLTNLYADPSTAVVRELFTNACDATGAEGTVTIQIERTSDDENAPDEYKFTITDYGCGMSAKQLKENYVTYAASTKIADFDSVGSFGLGSKSPMAIVPSYTVMSCNGEEQNKCTVARTGEGIFANLEKIENLGTSVSFTKVTFEGFSRSIAKEMDRYIRNVIVPFSKIGVNYASIFTVNEYSDSPLLKNKSYKHSFKIIRGAYEITLYADEAKDFYKMWDNRYVKHYARINNIVYPVDTSNNDEKEATSTVVIDVEPGYFAFAPSREELPRGEKLDHIKSIVTGKLWDTYDDFIKWVIEKKIVTAEEAYAYEKERNLFAKIADANCFAGISQEKIDNANFLIQHRHSDCKSDFEGVKGLHVYSYQNDSGIGYGHKTPQVFEEMPIMYLNDLFKKCTNLVAKKHENPYYKTVIKTTVVEGIKKGRRTGKIRIPAEFKKMAVANRMHDEKREMWVDTSARAFDRFEYVYVFVEEGVEIPENVKKRLSCCSLNHKWEVLDAKYITADYNTATSEGKPRRARVSVEDRDIKYRTSLSPYADYECKLSELPWNIGSAEDTIIAYRDTTDVHFIKLIASVTEKKVAVINDMTKGVYKYLTSLDYDIFNARPKNRGRYERNCKDVMYDDYDMLDNPNEFTKELISTICNLGLSRWVYLCNGYFEGYQNLDTTDFDITSEMHAKIRYHLDSSFKEDCDNVKKYLAPDYKDIDSHDDKIVNIICANISEDSYYAFSERNEVVSPIDIIDIDKFAEDNKEDIVKCKANSIILHKLRTIDPNYVVPRYTFAFEDEAINNVVKFVGSSKYYVIEDKACESDGGIIEGVNEALSELAENSDFKKYSPIYDDLEEGNELDELIKAKVDGAVESMTKKLDSIC